MATGGHVRGAIAQLMADAPNSPSTYCHRSRVLAAARRRSGDCFGPTPGIHVRKGLASTHGTACGDEPPAVHLGARARQDADPVAVQPTEYSG